MGTLTRLLVPLLGALALGGCSTGSGGDPVPPTASASPAAPESAPATAPTATTAAPPGYTFPVDGRARYGEYHHDYPAADVFAPCGTPVVAPTAGTITFVARDDVWRGSTNRGDERGGLAFALVGTDGVRYYGSHLRSLRRSVRVGAELADGAPIGEVGNTGDAAGIACHLHFGISPDCGTTDWWTRRGAVRPYRFLKAWQRGDDLSPVKAVREWKAAHGCPTEP